MDALFEPQSGCEIGQTPWSSTQWASRPRAYAEGAVAPASALLRQFAGDFADAAARIWRGRLLGEYFAADTARRQTWHACLASGNADFAPAPGDIVACGLAYRALTFERGKTLLARAFGRYPPGLSGALGRLGEEAVAADVYRDLAAVLLAGGLCARQIWRCKEIDQGALAALRFITSAPRAEALLAVLGRGKVALEDVARLAWVAARMEALNGPAFAAAILAAADPVEAAHQAWSQWPFPPPPWPGDDTLRHVANTRELTAAGKRFGNCLRNGFHRKSFAYDLMNGKDCLYEWHGEKPALLHFMAVGPLGWVLEQAKGPNNSRPDSATMMEIEKRLQAAPSMSVQRFTSEVGSWLRHAPHISLDGLE